MLFGAKYVLSFMKIVVIQNTIVDSPTACPVVINYLPFFHASVWFFSWNCHISDR